MKRFKVGDLVRLTDECNEWYAEHADWCHAVGSIVRILDIETLVQYGLDKFSYPNGLDIYCLIEGDNGERGSDFSYRVYYFNQIGFAEMYVRPKDIEAL